MKATRESFERKVLSLNKGMKRHTCDDLGNAQALQIDALARVHQIDVWTIEEPKAPKVTKSGNIARGYHLSPFATVDKRRVITVPIVDTESFICALHEISHCLDPHINTYQLPDELEQKIVAHDGSIDTYMQVRAEWRAWTIAEALAGSLWDSTADDLRNTAALTYGPKELWETYGPLYQIEWAALTARGHEWPMQQSINNHSKQERNQ